LKHRRERSKIVTKNEYPKYDPTEGIPGFGQVSNAKIAWFAPYHVPTAEEIASGKYVRRRYQPAPRWARWLFGTGEFEPSSGTSPSRPAELADDLDQASNGQYLSSEIRPHQSTLPRGNGWKEQEEARIWHEELGWGEKIGYILLVLVLPIAGAILTAWLAAQNAAH
jgi:hypothetical protein